MENEDSIHSFIDAVYDIGAKIAIDDFGTGLSNFSRVLKYHPDYIKIDGSLIKNIEKNKHAEKRRLYKKILETREQRFHLCLFAKNLTGYKTLMYLSSQAFIYGFYRYARINKKLLINNWYSENQIKIFFKKWKI